jgi:hypothetical protein
MRVGSTHLTYIKKYTACNIQAGMNKASIFSKKPRDRYPDTHTYTHAHTHTHTHTHSLTHSHTHTQGSAESAESASRRRPLSLFEGTKWEVYAFARQKAESNVHVLATGARRWAMRTGCLTDCLDSLVCCKDARTKTIPDRDPQVCKDLAH